MLVDDELLTREDDRWVVVVGPLRPSGSLVDPGAARRPARGPAGRRAGDRHRGVRRGRRCSTVARSSDLTPDSFEPTLELDLLALVRRDLIRPDFADFPGDEAYRFRHALIRDAAYRSLSKSTRRRPARALRRVARARGRGPDCASSRRSSATTWSRRIAAAPRSARSTRTRPRSRPGRRSGSSRQVDGRSRAATFPRRSACSSERRICSPSTHRDAQRCSPSSARR